MPATMLGALSGAAGAGGQGPAVADRTLTLPGETSPPLSGLEDQSRLLYFLSGRCARCRQGDRPLRDLAFEYSDQGVVLVNIFRRSGLRRERVRTEALTPQVAEVNDVAGTLDRCYGLNRQTGTAFASRQGQVIV